MRIKVLPAYNGDCLLLSFTNEDGKVSNVLIDGGVPRTYPKCLKAELLNINSQKQNIDLLIVTHIDDDHIGGIARLFADKKLDKTFIKEVWFNSGLILSEYFGTEKEESRSYPIIPSDTTKMSVRQGMTLENELECHGGWTRELIKSGKEYILNNLKLTVLSPNEDKLSHLNKKWEIEKDSKTTMSGKGHDDFHIPIVELAAKIFKEDNAIPNGSSIALLASLNGNSILLLGDAQPSVLISSLRKMGFCSEKKLRVDFVKVSHHASKGNTSNELLDLIDCSHFIVCTDGSKHGLPDKEALARIIHKFNGCTLYFNYRNKVTESIFLESDIINYKFNCVYLKDLNFTINL